MNYIEYLAPGGLVENSKKLQRLVTNKHDEESTINFDTIRDYVKAFRNWIDSFKKNSNSTFQNSTSIPAGIVGSYGYFGPIDPDKNISNDTWRNNQAFASSIITLHE